MRTVQHISKHISVVRDELNERLAEAKRKLKPASWKELSGTEFPPNQWLVNQIVPTEGVTIISAAPGSYKTWLILQMASNITQGQSFLGQFACEKHGVYIVDEENHPRLIQKRLRLLGTPEDASIELSSQKGFLVTDEWMRKALLELCKERSADVIIFDSLIRISRADENDARSMDEVFQWLRSFCREGKTVIVTHHERKEGLQQRSSPGNRLRGSSNISAQVDSHLALTRDRNDKRRLVIEHAKGRETEESQPFEICFQTDDDKAWFEYRGYQTPKKTKKDQALETILPILNEHSSGLTKTELVNKVATLVGVGVKNAQKALDELITQGLVETRKGNGNTTVCFFVPQENNPPLES